jgi:Mn2+/Fe2+ NRAMP family transporter
MLTTIFKIVEIIAYIIIAVDVYRLLVSIKNGEFNTKKTDYLFLSLYFIFAVWTIVSLINNRPWSIKFLIMVTAYLNLKRKQT